jgi:hypothetical protein
MRPMLLAMAMLALAATIALHSNVSGTTASAQQDSFEVAQSVPCPNNRCVR